MSLNRAPSASEVEPKPSFDIGFMVMRPMAWDQFTQNNDLGEKIPAHFSFGMRPSPVNWLPVFSDIEAARDWADGGRFPIIMLSQRLGPVTMPATVPDPCPRCGVIHWTACPFTEGEITAKGSSNEHLANAS